jgi:hypothetical protein
MDDHKWEDSATQWEINYRRVKADLDALEVKLRKIYEAGMKTKRGCDCEYDHRCCNCDSIVALHNIIEEMNR